MRHFRIQKGEWPSGKVAPAQKVSETPPIRSAAIQGSDFPGLRPRFEVEEDAKVEIGQVLFRDRKHPEIAFVSPITGRVASLVLGQRRTLSACIIEAEASDRNPKRASIPNLDETRKLLLSRGFWPAFRTRPFGRMPAPDTSPVAIVVNAVHAAPQSPDPLVVVAENRDAFKLGLQCLSRLTEGEVFVCQSPGSPLAADEDRVTSVAFSGSLAAGLASTQIDRLCPTTPKREVWTVGYQDVVAIGNLFQTGEYTAERVVAIVGPAVKRPRLVSTCLGARLANLCETETGAVLSGDELSGRRSAYLGWFDHQVTIVLAHPRMSKTSWLDSLFGQSRVLIPNRRLERSLAVDIPAVPLLRALAVGDSEAAARLGCLSLVEEDVAALARRCTSGADYPQLLRRALDDLMADTA